MQTQTVDITPSWEQLVPALIMLVKEGTTHEARETGLESITRMAQLADMYVQVVELVVKQGPVDSK